MLLLIIVVAVIGWFSASVAAAFFVGAAVRLADQRRTPMAHLDKRGKEELT